MANVMKDKESFWVSKEQYYESGGKELLHQTLSGY